MFNNNFKDSYLYREWTKLTAVHLIRTMLTRIGSTTAQWHATVGARALSCFHHLFVLGTTILEPDFHLQ